MHDIEPYYQWRDYYVASEDEHSPFYGREYSEFQFSQKVYNYYLHPQWDEFGSATLYLKILHVDYDEGSAILEMIGEWNDCISNDIMFLKREVIDPMLEMGIVKFILVCENVLNFHGSDDCYYEEWHQEVVEEGGWICLLNTLDHVSQEMAEHNLQSYIHFGPHFNDVSWRHYKPKNLVLAVDVLLGQEVRQLPY